MKKKLKKSQALVEMAIFGTLILAILGSLLSYLQKMNEQQYVKQEAFRQALAKSDDVQSSVNYTVMTNKRNVSVHSPLVGDRGSYSSASTVLWGITPEGEENLGGVYYKINEDEFKLDLDDDSDSEGAADAKSEEEEKKERSIEQAQRQFISNVVNQALKKHPNGPNKDMATRVLTEKIIETLMNKNVEESVDENVSSSIGIENVATKVESNMVNNKRIDYVPHQVTSYQEAKVDESITYTFQYSDGTQYAVTQHIGSDGRYSQNNSDSSEYVKERSWVSSYE